MMLGGIRSIANGGLGLCGQWRQAEDKQQPVCMVADTRNGKGKKAMRRKETAKEGLAAGC
jgi:hypothetical protein